MNKNIARLIEVFIFIVIALLVVDKASLYYSSYGKESDDNDRTTRLFYELPNNSVDVVFLGDSHSYCSYIPQRIYKKTGITSASLATSSSSIVNAYWQLKEVLIKQKPKIVVVEAHIMKSIYDLDTKNANMHITSGLYMMPDLSLNKYECLFDMKKNNYGSASNVDYKDIVGLFNFKQDKDRRNDNIENILKYLNNPKSYFNTFGYSPSGEIHSLYTISQGEEQTVMDLKNTLEFDYLNSIYKLCKENNIDLIISMAPFYNTKETGGIYEQLFSWAKENNIKHINYFDLIEEIDLDLRTDFKDSRHLNYWGAKKVTDYFIDYIGTNYSLIDHRGDTKYSLWEDMEYDYETINEQLNIAESEL